MAKVVKTCGCAKALKGDAVRKKKWHKCTHPWVVKWRNRKDDNRLVQLAFVEDPSQDETSFRRAERCAGLVEHEMLAGRTATRERIKRLMAGIDDHLVSTSNGVTFGAWATKVVETKAIALRKASNLQYKANLTRTCRRFGHYELEEIDREMIQGYISDLTNEEKLSPYTILGIYIFLAIVFKEAVLSEKIRRTPCRDIKLPRCEKQRFFIKPTLGELEILCEEIVPQYRVAVWLMHGLGLRIGEALGASTHDVLDAGSTFRAQRQVTQRGEIGPLKHRDWGQYRDIPMSRFTYERVVEHVDRFGVQEDGRLIRGVKKPLPSHDGLRQGFVRGLDNTDLPPTMRPHDLRHAWVSDLLAAGVPITDVSRWVGHNHITTTQRIYGHEVPSAFSRGRLFLTARYEQLVAGQDPATVGFSWFSAGGREAGSLAA